MTTTPEPGRGHSPAHDPAPQTMPVHDPHKMRTVQLIVLGGVVALLAPLGGFLVGSSIGPDRSVGPFDAMFVALFVGMVVGALGVVALVIGAVRAVRHIDAGGGTGHTRD